MAWNGNGWKEGNSWAVRDRAAEANEHRPVRDFAQSRCNRHSYATLIIAGCITVSIAARLREVPSQARASYATDTYEADVHRTSVMKQERHSSARRLTHVRRRSFPAQLLERLARMS
jgi:hypothetical protein